MERERLFCKEGGCTAKLGPGILDRVLKKLPRKEDENLLAGFEHAEDAAVYRLSRDTALVQTLDFFPPVVDDPYLFGQIAAANAMSDIYAMGGEVKTALNIVCFPETMDLNLLGEILRGGAEKVEEAGGILAGGHSIADSGVKYGLSVTGLVHPDRVLRNHTPHPGDKLILTKPLGVGIITAAGRVGEASAGALEAAVSSMTMLNRYAAEAASGFPVHACTDVTGFGFLGHLTEMLEGGLSARIQSGAVPFIPQSYDYAQQLLLTAAAQRNRDFVGSRAVFGERVTFPMEELLFDPQTSGGLLFAVEKAQAEPLLDKLRQLSITSGIVGEVTEKAAYRIYVE